MRTTQGTSNPAHSPSTRAISVPTAPVERRPLRTKTLPDWMWVSTSVKPAPSSSLAQLGHLHEAAAHVHGAQEGDVGRHAAHPSTGMPQWCACRQQPSRPAVSSSFATVRPSGAATGGTPGAPTSPSTAVGERDARQLAPRLAGFDLRLVLCSPLSRARRTAELAGLDPVTDDDLMEWDYGGYEGRTTSEIREDLGDPGWTVFGDGVVPGATPGETVEEVAARASRVLTRVAEPLRRGDVALVAHGHLLRILAATYLHQDARFGAQLLLDAGAVCVLDHERGVPAVRSWNETCRLSLTGRGRGPRSPT